MELLIDGSTIEIKDIPTTGTPCYLCGDNVFAVTTPMGGEYVTCPLCETMCECCGYNWQQYEDIDDGDDEYHYCGKCNIAYDVSSVHAENGCTSGIYFGKLITNFEYNNQNYEGMPVFQSYRDFMKLKKHISFHKQMVVKKIACKNAFYPIDKYPQYYGY